MSRRRLCFLCLAPFLSAGMPFAATSSPAATAATTAAPVAFVYVTSNYKDTTNRIAGYAAAANGKLTPVPDSPFSHNVSSMAVNGKYLFAAGVANSDIYTFSIGPHGYLTQVAATNVQKFPRSSTCASPGVLTLDRTGGTLYPAIFNIDCSEDDAYQSLKVATANGTLSYLSHTGATNIGDYVPLIFIGNNKIAYAVTGGMYSQINGFRRASSGSLVDMSIGVTYVTAADGNSYTFQTGSADATNHLAVALISDTGTSQMASYSANATNGNLSTTSTYKNMPKVSVAGVRNTVKGVLTTSIAPSGKLVAVGGTTGLQIFHFNGAAPLTVDTGALTSDEIDQVFWDNDNHLYAISKSAGKLFVFTVTPTSAEQATGSPHTIAKPADLVVQSR